MKIKKSITKVIVIWSIFFISAISFAWFISLQNNDINSFWIVKKIDLSLINKTYADDDDDDDDDDEKSSNRKSKERYKDDDDDEDDDDDDDNDNKKYKLQKIPTTKTTSSWCSIIYDSVTTASWSNIIEPVEVCNTVKPVANAIVEPVITKIVEPIKKVEVVKTPNIITINDSEKAKIKKLLTNFATKIDKTNYTDLKKLNLFRSIWVSIDKKISILNTTILSTKDQVLLEKYEKKLLLLKEVNLNIESQILVYIDDINTNLKIVAEKEKDIAAQAAATKAAQDAAAAKAKIAAQAAATKAAQDAAAAKAKIAAQAAATKAAQDAAAAKAKAAQDAAAAKAKADAQAAAKAKTTTKTKAS